jgi:hypothetical protein
MLAWELVVGPMMTNIATYPYSSTGRERREYMATYFSSFGLNITITAVSVNVDRTTWAYPRQAYEHAQKYEVLSFERGFKHATTFNTKIAASRGVARRQDRNLHH